MLEDTMQNIILETYINLYIDCIAKFPEDSKQTKLIKNRLTTLIKRYKGEQ
tara:strand:+ start:186 stop:338 length:153 start_codon:yes stop_codon:yes gene_type:complete